MMITGKMAGVGVAIGAVVLESSLDALNNGEQMGQLLQLLDKEIALPNVKFPTMGGRYFWTDIKERDGWRLQRNDITHHARILDRNNVRYDWGTLNGMYKEWNRLVGSSCK